VSRILWEVLLSSRWRAVAVIAAIVAALAVLAAEAALFAFGDFLAGRTRGLPLALVVVAAITFVLLLTWLASKR
jgi:hypothetical protein